MKKRMLPGLMKAARMLEETRERRRQEAMARYDVGIIYAIDIEDGLFGRPNRDLWDYYPGTDAWHRK
jgi:hypothetical protein